MTSFICVYNFAVFGMIILSQIMSFEGNYIDGLMSRKESIMSLLKAKYYIYSIGEIIPFLLMIPAIIMNKLTLLGAFAWSFIRSASSISASSNWLSTINRLWL